MEITSKIYLSLCKSVCQLCGTINGIDGADFYDYNKNVYTLNSCDNKFFLDFDSTDYEFYNSVQHTKSLKKGQYCQFCKGTYARATTSRESHNFDEVVDGQIGNNRFYISENCSDCGYETSEYVTAKSVVSSYYGVADGEAHTLTVSDLSDRGVNTSIRYGDSAENCNKTSAPNYTQPGYYTVYYEITYTYENEDMTENGVSYVWILDDDANKQDNDDRMFHNHDYRYLETVPPTCDELGYERWQCNICGSLQKQNYKQPISHNYEDITIREATCKQGGLVLSICKNCGDFHQTTTPKGEHDYQKKTIAPTCKNMGYDEYTCSVCGNTYTNNMQSLIFHRFGQVTKDPTCTEQGYTTYTCEMCGMTYTNDYTDPTGHDWDEGHAVTSSTCIGEGVIEYWCRNCDEKMIKATSATGHKLGAEATCTQPQTCEACGTILEPAKGHSFKQTVIPPTCISMGYTKFECENCDEAYNDNYTERTAHRYKKDVTAPTCTSSGYTTFTCEDCGDTYKGEYIDRLSHNYQRTLTPPTCTKLGYTTFVCSECEDTYTGEYVSATGHKPGNWIIDTDATIEHPGKKHIECEVCQTVLQEAETPQLADEDHSDEDGNVQVGQFSIILTDKDGKPIFDSIITIDAEDNVTIKLPSGRLLDYADQTTITAFYTDTQEAVSGLKIFIYDEKDNAATGETDAQGQLKVPNNQSSTGDDNGTIGGEDNENGNKFTFVVTVTNKNNFIIPNCGISIGENNHIVVDLPEGVKPTKDEPVIITVTDQNGTAQKDITVIALGDADFIEKGVTDVYGQVTLPQTKDGYTDKSGLVSIEGYNVIVNDEQGFIENAYVEYAESGITVTLPEGKKIDYENRTTVTVLDQNGEAVKDFSVTVIDSAENTRADKTDENGKITVPPLSEDYTDSEGKGQVNGLNVFVTDEKAAVENAFIQMIDGKISVTLPQTSRIEVENRITVVVTDSENKPVKDMSVTVNDTVGKTETDLTDESGEITVPPIDTDYTDKNGQAQVDGLLVTVKNETTDIENAFVTHTKDGQITVKLPENAKIDYANRITVMVQTKFDLAPVPGVIVTVSEATSGKSMGDKTDKNGCIVVPPVSQDMTDDKGDSDVTETLPGEDKDTDGDGKPDAPGEETTVTYKVTVENNNGIIPNSFIEVQDGKITVELPEGYTLTTANQTTVTVLDKDDKPVSGMSVTVKDKDNAKSGTTNSNGKVTLPVKTSSGGSGGSSSGGSHSSGGGLSSGVSSTATTVTVTDKDGKTVTGFSKSTDSKGVITLTLPSGKTLEDGNWYTVTVKDGSGKAKANTTVTLKDRNGRTASGTTDANGKAVIPGAMHTAYIVGYDDGTFRPDSDMSRAEAAAIFARLISEAKDENISGKASFKDIPSGEWYSSYVGYLEKYNIIKGYTDGTFKPDDPVTRAEFVAMTVRYYGLFDKVSYPANTTKYSDLNGTHWAIRDISFAKNIGWLNGYADGTFRPDNNITRAEVVTVVNHTTGREPDKEYINKNLSVLNKFTDLKTNTHWAFYDIIEAANTHMAVSKTSGEMWVK